MATKKNTMFQIYRVYFVFVSLFRLKDEKNGNLLIIIIFPILSQEKK